MKARSLEVKDFTRATYPLFSCTKTSKVLGCFRDNIGSQFHLNTTLRGAADGDVKEYYWVFRHVCLGWQSISSVAAEFVSLLFDMLW
jgi:hypothetical protein